MERSNSWLTITLLPILLCTLLFYHTNAATLSFVGVESEVTTVSATTTLSVYSTIIQQVEAGGYFQITIPDSTSINNGALSCSMIDPTSISVSCSGETTSRTITVVLQNTLPANTYFQVDIEGFTNPSTTLTTDTFIFRSYTNKGNMLDEKTSSISLSATAGTLTSAVMTASDQTVAASNTVLFNITTTHLVTSGGTIQVSMPKWNPNASTNDILSMIQGSYVCSALENLDNTISCSFNNSTDILTVSSAFNSTSLRPGTTIRFSVSGFRNPISTATKTGFTVTTYGVDGGAVDSLDTSITVTDAAAITSGTLSSTGTRIVQTLTVMRLTFPSPVPLDTGCIINVTFPSELPITATDLTSIRGVGLFGSSRNMTANIDTASNTVIVTDGCQTYVSPDFDAVIEFTRISNPTSTKPTDSVTITISDVNSNLIAQRTSGTQYIASFGSMTTGTLSATPTTISSTASATVTMFPSHKITTSSSLKITFPSSVSFPSKACTLTDHEVIQTSAVWAISNQVVTISSPFSSDYIPSAASTDTIKFTINNITMPASTSPTGTFIFSSNLVSGGIDYVIDRSSYTNLITATAGSITTASVTPTTLLANALTTYTFSFVNNHAVVENGKVIVTFPSEIIIPNPTQAANLCRPLTGLEKTAICSATSSSVTVTGGFSGTSVAAGTTISFSIDNVQNPASLQPSSSFSIETATADDYAIEDITSGVIVTMTSVSDLTSVAISPESLVNGADTALELRTVSSSPLQDGDVMLITFPPTVGAPSGKIACNGITALESSMTCSKISTNPDIISMTLNFTIDEVNASELLRFKIENCTNPTTTEPSDSFDFEIKNSNGYLVNTYSGTVRVTTTEAAQFTSSSIATSSTVANEDVTITLSFTLAHDFPGSGIIYVDYPSQVGFNVGSLSCQCIEAGAASTTSTCTCAQTTFSGESMILISNSFLSGLSSGSSVELEISGFTMPSTAIETNSFQVYTYTGAKGYKIDKTESGLTLQSQCDYPCLTCGKNTSVCFSCISTTAVPYKLQENSCVLECDSDKFYNSSTNECED